MSVSMSVISHVLLCSISCLRVEDKQTHGRHALPLQQAEERAAAHVRRHNRVSEGGDTAVRARALPARQLHEVLGDVTHVEGANLTRLVADASRDASRTRREPAARKARPARPMREARCRRQRVERARLVACRAVPRYTVPRRLLESAIGHRPSPGPCGQMPALTTDTCTKHACMQLIF